MAVLNLRNLSRASTTLAPAGVLLSMGIEFRIAGPTRAFCIDSMVAVELVITVDAMEHLVVLLAVHCGHRQELHVVVHGVDRLGEAVASALLVPQKSQSSHIIEYVIRLFAYSECLR